MTEGRGGRWGRRRLWGAMAAPGVLLALLIVDPATIRAARASASWTAESIWATAYHDPERTGRTPVIGPQSPRLPLTYPLGIVFRGARSDGESWPVANGGRVFLTHEWCFAWTGPCEFWGTLVGLTPRGRIRFPSAQTRVNEALTPALDPDGTIYVPAAEGLVALEPTGARRWTAPALDVVSPVRGPFGVYRITNRGRIELRDAVTGAMLREDDVHGRPFQMSISPDGSVYYTSPEPRPPVGFGASAIVALGPDLNERWHTWTNGVDPSVPLVLSPDGTLFGVSSFDRVFALNGSLPKWSTVVPASLGTRLALAADGTLYAHTDRAIIAFAPEGRVLWSHDEVGGMVSDLVIGGDGTLYYLRSGEFVARTPLGHVRWRQTLPLAAHGNAKLAITADGRLVAVTRGLVFSMAP